jgi:hypothetical protein
MEISEFSKETKDIVCPYPGSVTSLPSASTLLPIRTDSSSDNGSDEDDAEPCIPRSITASWKRAMNR